MTDEPDSGNAFRTVRRRLRVIGRVQGVGFRAWTVRRAAGLRLHGYVRNCADGSVEVEVEGDESAVFSLVELLRRGPAMSIVREVRDLPPGTTRLPDGFEVSF